MNLFISIWRPLLFFAALLILVTLPTRATDTYLAPQAELFITHNSMFRSHFIASGNYLTREGAFSSAWVQYDIDIGLVSFFRRYLFKDPNTEKSKRFSFRLGYLQVSDLKDDPNGFDEKRPFAEILFRVPAGRAWLFEDRNRGEYRIFHNEDVTRYRNRLRIERAVAFKSVKATPYATGEIFYDGKTDRWNEFQTAIGIDFPMRYRTVLELETLLQVVDGELNSVSYSVVFQKHM
jgi:hypothetical protein